MAPNPIQSIQRSRSTTTAMVLVLGTSALANLTVHDSLNRYSLYGRVLVSFEDRANTATGGWVGSDSAILLKGQNNLRSTVTSGDSLFLQFGGGSGPDTISGRTIVGRYLHAQYNNTLDSAVYVGDSVYTGFNGNFMRGLLIGRNWTGRVKMSAYASPSNSFNGNRLVNGTTTTYTAAIPGVTFGANPPKPFVAFPLPDTTIAPGSIDITATATGYQSHTLTCADLAAITTNLLGGCVDTTFTAPKSGLVHAAILPPGSYGDLTLGFGTVLYLREGVYHFHSMNLFNSSPTQPTRLLALQPNGARTVIVTENGLASGSSAPNLPTVIAPAAYEKGYGTDTSKFAGGTMMLVSHATTTLSNFLNIWATVTAPNDTVFLLESPKLFGQIFAKRIITDNSFKGTDGAFIPYFPRAPKVSVANSGWIGPEGAQGQATPAVFTLQMDHMNGLPVTIWYHTVTPLRDTTYLGKVFKPAFAGDYDSLPALHGASVTIPATQTTATFSINIHGNNIHQPNRNFLVIFDSIQNGTLDSTTLWNGNVAAGGFILDDDPTPTFRLAGDTAFEGTGPGTKPFKFVLTLVDSITGVPIVPSLSGGGIFTWSTIPGTADSTSFTPVHGAFDTMPPGRSTDTLIVRVRQDSIYEPNETFFVHIDTFSNVQAKSTKNVRLANGLILNDDSEVTVSINDTSIVRSATVSETMLFKVRLINFTSTTSSSGNVSVVNWRLLPLTAVRGLDYKDSSGTLTFRASLDSVLTIPVTILPDSRYYGTNLQFQVVLTVVSGVDGKAWNIDTVGIGSIQAAVGRPLLHIYDTSALEGGVSDHNPLNFRVALLDSLGNPATSRDTVAFTWKTLPTGSVFTSDSTDFTAVPLGLGQILPAQGSTSLVVLLNGNRLYQDNRTLGIQILSGGCGCTNANQRLGATGTILDDDLPPLVAIDDQTGYRAATDTTFVFRARLLDPANPTVSWPSGKALTFRWRTLDSTAKFAAPFNDYFADSGTLSFAPGDTFKTISVKVRPDNRFAPPLFFKVVLDSLHGGLFQDSIGVGTILNRNPKPIVIVTGHLFNEAQGTAKIWVSLVDSTLKPITSRVPVPFTWIATDSTAVNGIDFNLLSASPDTVQAFSQIDSLRFGIIVRKINLPDREFRVTIDPDTNTFAPNQSVLTALDTIRNSYPLPNVLVNSIRVTEPQPGDTTKLAVFTVYLSSPSGFTNVVRVRTADSTAIKDVDYRAADSTLVFPPLTDSLTFSVRLLNDGIWDTAQRFKAIIVSSGNLTSSAPIGVGAIVNSDLPPRLNISPDTNIVPKDSALDSWAYFHVSLDRPSNIPVTVFFTTNSLNSKIAGVLYDSTARTLNFAPGVTDRLDSVRIIASPLKLSHHYFFAIDLSNGQASTDPPTLLQYRQNRSVVLIYDASGKPRVSIDSATTPKRDTTIYFHLKLDRPVDTAIVIHYQTFGITALPGRDFVFDSSFVTIPARDTLDSIAVHVLADKVYFPEHRQFHVFIQSDTLVAIFQPNGIGTIVDANPPSVSIQDAIGVREGQTAYFPIGLSQPDADTIRVVWSTVDGSAKGGTNFLKHTSDTLVIAPGQNSLQIPITTLDDGLYDTTLHFGVHMDTVLGGNAWSGLPRSGSGTIFDGGTKPEVHFVHPDTAVLETQDSLWLPVALTRKIAYPVTVPVNVDSSFSSALTGLDYDIPVHSVTFPAGADTTKLLVLVHHDSVKTENTLLVLNLAPDPGDSVGTDASSVSHVTILNVDPPPYLSFQDSLIAVTIGDTSISLVLQLSKYSGKTITGTISILGGNARPGTDFDPPSGGFTFPPGTKSLSLPLTLHDDHRYGPVRDLFVHLGPLDTSKVLLDPLATRATGDARDTVLHVIIQERIPRPNLSFSPVSDTVPDASGLADANVVLSTISDSFSVAHLVLTDTSRPEIRSLHFELAADSAVVDSGKKSATVRLTWQNDGKASDTSRVVHLVLRGSTGAGIGTDSVFTLALINTNKGPLVRIVVPVDSVHTDNANQPVDWTVNGTPEPRTDTLLREGWNVITKCYTDSSGNTGCDTHHVWADFTPPRVTIVQLNGAAVVQPDTSIHLVNHVKNHIEWDVIDSGATWRDSTHGVLDTVLAEGLHRIVRTACDSVGNCGSDSIAILVDTTPPKVIIVSPANGDTVGNAVNAVHWTWQDGDTGTLHAMLDTMTFTHFGWNDITRCATDLAGNTGCATAQVFYKVPSVAKAYYLDANGDGRIDEAVVTFNASWVGDSLPLFTLTLGGQTQTGLKAQGYLPGSHTSVVVVVDPSFPFGMTSVGPLDTGTYSIKVTETSANGTSGATIVTSSFDLEDSVAPVIQNAVIHRTESYSGQDTLFITPSESIRLGAGKDWLEVLMCPGGLNTCDSSEMEWKKVPADSVFQGPDSRYWFLIPPGDTGSIRPNYKVRFLESVSDTLGNKVDTANLHWATTVTGGPRPDLVQVLPPNRISVVPLTENTRITPGVILFKATKGKSDGTPGTLYWWEPGQGYNVDMGVVNNACPESSNPYLNWCSGPTIYINRPMRMILYIYDLAGVFVTSRQINITQADLDAMMPDQLDRVSIQLEWNNRTNDGHLVASGVYLWRIVSYVQVYGKALPVINNQLFKLGVKVQGINGQF